MSWHWIESSGEVSSSAFLIAAQRVTWNSTALLSTPPSLRVKTRAWLCPVFCFLIVIPQIALYIKYRYLLRAHFWTLDTQGHGVYYCWVLVVQRRHGEAKPVTFSLFSIILDSTKIYIILHFVRFRSPHFLLSLVLLSSPATFFSCECGPPWDMVHLWRSQHNSGFTLSFHQEFLGINLKSLRLHGTSFSCWAVHRSILLFLKSRGHHDRDLPFKTLSNPDYTPDTRFSNGNFKRVNSQWMHI